MSDGLRIIAGTARGTRLQTLPLGDLRPMLDRVREAMFNILRNLTPGARVLDLFSGSGSLGLEALSRGAVHSIFVEGDPRLSRLVGTNIEKCHFEDRAHVLNVDAMTLAARFPPAAHERADIVLADPPYAVIDDPNRRTALFRVLEGLMDYWLTPDAIVVLHHRPMRYVLWPTDIFEEWDQRVYGQSQLTFLEPAGASANE